MMLNEANFNTMLSLLKEVFDEKVSTYGQVGRLVICGELFIADTFEVLAREYV
jgi:alkylated DNA nucleotide flippase Atl1